MDFSHVTLDDVKPMVAGAGDQMLTLWGWIYYVSSIPYRLIFIWPSYYVGLIFWWPIYVI